MNNEQLDQAVAALARAAELYLATLDDLARPVMTQQLTIAMSIVRSALPQAAPEAVEAPADPAPADPAPTKASKKAGK